MSLHLPSLVFGALLALYAVAWIAFAQRMYWRLRYTRADEGAVSFCVAMAAIWPVTLVMLHLAMRPSIPKAQVRK